MPLNIWQISYKIAFVILVLIFVFGLAWFLSGLIRKYCKINPAFRPISSVIIFFVRLLLYLIAFLIILDNLGIEIGPLLASLGISGLAISLALVDVLKDIFAGIYILAEKNIKNGDYVHLTGGDEGEVAEIGWRSIKLKEKSGGLIIIPNQKFYQSSITVKK